MHNNRFLDKDVLVDGVLHPNYFSIFNSLFSTINNISEDDINKICEVHEDFGFKLRQYQVELRKFWDYYHATTIKVGDKEFYMNSYLQELLDHFVKSVNKKWDFVCLITGMEGSAKSTLAKAVSYYLTKTFNDKNDFNVDNIVFTAQQFNEAVNNLPVGSAILWDEFVLGGLSTDVGKLQNMIIKQFTLIRKKRLFIILVIPFIWMLRTYFAVARTKVLIDVGSPDFIRRGFFKVWGYNSKKDVYFKGMTSGSKWSYRVKPDFYGTFLKDISKPNFFVDDVAYEKKKDEAIKSLRVLTKEELKDEKDKLKKEKEIVEGIKTSVTCKICKTRNVYFFKNEGVKRCKICDTVQ